MINSYTFLSSAYDFNGFKTFEIKSKRFKEVNIFQICTRGFELSSHYNIQYVKLHNMNIN